MADPYTDPDAQAEATIDAMATRLEERGANPKFRAMIGDYLATIPRGRPLRVMDLGCGTGVVTRMIRAHLAAESAVYGVDLSERLLEKARSIAGGAAIRWVKNEPGPLPFEDGGFDVVVMHTLVSHVPDLDACLREARRVLKAEGRLIIFDADYASTTYGYPDFERARAIDLALLSGLVTRLDVCRQLPRFLKAAGFRLSSHRSYLLSEAGRGDYFLSSVQSFARLIPALGLLPRDEGEAWVEHMLASHEDGSFFAAAAYYTFFAELSPGPAPGRET